MVGRVRTKTVKKASRNIIEKYYPKLTRDFHTNKRICEGIALLLLPSREIIDGYGTDREVFHSDILPVQSCRVCDGASCALFLGAGLLEYVKLRKPNIFQYLKYLSPNELFSVNTRLNAYDRLSPGHRCTLAIIGINICVCLAWKVKYFKNLMNYLFVCRFSPRDIHLPVLLSSFSHQDLLHLALDMTLLGDSAPLMINSLLNINEFCCFYLAAGMFGSVASLAGRHYRGHYNVGSMGATSIVSANLVYRLMKQPGAQIHLLWFRIDARIFVAFYMLFDLTGLLFFANPSINAAHLGGSLFGLFYATCGELLYRKLFPAGRRFGDVHIE